MSMILDLTDDTLQPVEIVWSKKYHCPLYKVGDKTYIGDTGEYAGYFDEVAGPEPAPLPKLKEEP